MKKILFNFKFSICILSVLFFLGCGNDEKEANTHFNTAREFRQKNDFPNALNEYHTIIYCYPKSLLVSKAKKLALRCEEEIQIEKIFNMANTLTEQKYLTAALFVYRDLVDKHPDTYLNEDIRKKINMLTDNHATEILEMAKKNYEKGNYLEAIELYKKFMQDFPYNTEITQVRANLVQCEEAQAAYLAKKDKDKEKELKRKEEEKKLNEEERKKLEKERIEQENRKRESDKQQKIENALKALKEKTR